MSELYYNKFTLDEIFLVLNELAKKKEENDLLFHKWYVKQCEFNPKFKAIIEAKMLQSINRWKVGEAQTEPIEFTDAQIEQWLKRQLYETY